MSQTHFERCFTKRKRTKVRKHRAPFGSNAPRFNGTLGLHPSLNPESFLARMPGVGPADRLVEKPRGHLPHIDWRKQLHLDDINDKLEKIREKRRYDETFRGCPGTYEFDTFIEILAKQSHNVYHDLTFGKCQRRSFSSNTPGPGTYTRAYRKPKSQCATTSVPSFEWPGNQKRIAALTVDWHLPPNVHVYKDPESISEKTKRKAGLRGIFDTFTGPRDGSTIKNHFAPSNSKCPPSWPYDVPSGLDELKKRSLYGKLPQMKRFTGLSARIMLTDPSLCPKDPYAPGPGCYNVPSRIRCKPSEEDEENMYAFNSSVCQPRPNPPFELKPGPGRYNTGRPTRKIIPYHSVFKSKVLR